MSETKFRELAALSNEDLSAKLGELRYELIKLYGEVSTRTVPKSPAKIRQSKRAIARIKTLLARRAAKE
ncbi:MAG: 50S ribosomal protein L29 [Candidatus Woesearchaeota archaeon]